MKFPKIFLKAKEEIDILKGAPWVYDNEILCVKYVQSKQMQSSWEDFSLPDGIPAEVYSKSGLFLGTGIINKKSKIAVRFLSKDKAEKVFGEGASWENFQGQQNETVAFFEKKLEEALKIRYLFYTKSDSYRLCFGESDFIPGFIADRYRDIEGRVFLSVQFLSLAAEVFRSEIISALEKLCHPYGIYERSDVAVRELEGLEQKKGWIGGEHNPKIVIRENGVLLTVDLEKGQKTGYFLDQKDNRRLVADLAKGCRVLDTFTHTGAFGLNAVKGGAKEVISVDISPEAIETVEENIRLNKAGTVMKAVCADVFDLLREYEKKGETFDLIILDPPAFAKSAGKITKAYGGYKEINLTAMKLLSLGGLLVTCSCSHFFDTATFYEMLLHAGQDAHRSVQILEKRGPGPDHPQLMGYDRGEYLKCAVLRVL